MVDRENPALALVQGGAELFHRKATDLLAIGVLHEPRDGLASRNWVPEALVVYVAPVIRVVVADRIVASVWNPAQDVHEELRCFDLAEDVSRCVFDGHAR